MINEQLRYRHGVLNVAARRRDETTEIFVLIKLRLLNT